MKFYKKNLFLNLLIDFEKLGLIIRKVLIPVWIFLFHVFIVIVVVDSSVAETVMKHLQIGRRRAFPFCQNAAVWVAVSVCSADWFLRLTKLIAKKSLKMSNVKRLNKWHFRCYWDLRWQMFKYQMNKCQASKCQASKCQMSQYVMY